MKIDDIQITGTQILATAADVDALEKEFWFEFPPGYRAYVTKLGEGVLGGNFVRIYPPWRIRKELNVWRGRIRKHWFWESGAKILPKERALECVIIGDTVNGDELVFHPARPRDLFVLPRKHGKTSVAGTDLLAAVEWMCSSGKLTKPFAERRFEPFDSRKISSKGGKVEIDDPDGESLDEIASVGQHWAKRHKALKKALKDLAERLKEVGIVDAKTTLLYEAVLLDGEYPHTHGYLAHFKVEDPKSHAQLGTFSWHMTSGSHGFSYEPAANSGR